MLCTNNQAASRGHRHENIGDVVLKFIGCWTKYRLQRPLPRRPRHDAVRQSSKHAVELKLSLSNTQDQAIVEVMSPGPFVGECGSEIVKKAEVNALLAALSHVGASRDECNF
jgi:hypothetical protein